MDDRRRKKTGAGFQFLPQKPNPPPSTPNENEEGREGKKKEKNHPRQERASGYLNCSTEQVNGLASSNSAFRFLNKATAASAADGTAAAPSLDIAKSSSCWFFFSPSLSFLLFNMIFFSNKGNHYVTKSGARVLLNCMKEEVTEYFLMALPSSPSPCAQQL